MQQTIKLILKKIPLLYDFISRKKIESQHQHLMQLLNGNPSQDTSNQRSVLHFSINKAATQHVKGVLQRFSEENDLIPVDYNGYAFATDLPYLDLLTYEEMEQYKHIFRPKGYLYSVLGGMVKNIDSMDEYRIILTVRDPRDILVSKYYSMAFSHTVPQKTGNKRSAFQRKREAVKKMNIDEFVLGDLNTVLSRFRAYEKKLLKANGDVTLLRYEDMITNYRGWLKDLATGGGFSIRESLLNKMIAEFEKSRVPSEDKFRHIRKGKSGDYKEKLKPATIQKLNKAFRPYMISFGYSPDELD